MTPDPVIAIPCDNRDNTAASGRYESPLAYSRAVALAGGVPVLLPQVIQRVEDFLDRCHGLLLTGGADPDMTCFGKTTHPAARLVDPGRQAFELALLRAWDRRPRMPLLAVCLGMQLWALHAGGDLHQHLPEVLLAPQVHQRDHRHGVILRVSDSALSRGLVTAELGPEDRQVVSWHHQAVRDAGRLRVAATAADGVIEAVDDPTRPFAVGVQWHPERGGAGPLNQGLVDRLVAACRPATAATS